ncbi:glycosyl hydrolase family 18 protein [Aminipila sp.]|uniref:glycosyl hydrolase family 18 protein n=1 Tax=Aminipila sp. TaxID=2060095 RepID=UPI00289D28E8|nr:glycosyl hydrolase family 18 protein [Aminipila sp.]
MGIRKRSLKGLCDVILIIVIVSMLVTMPVAAFADESGNRQLNDINDKFRVVGYYCGDAFNNPIEEVQFDKFTHIIYGFLIPTKDGGLIPIEKKDELAEIVSRAHKSGTKVFIAVGGYSYQNTPLKEVFETIGASKDLRENFTDNLLKFVIENKLDGVDFDWEYPRYATAVDYEATVKLLSQKLKKEGKELSASVAGTGAADGVNAWEAIASITDETVNCFSFINLMSYDLNSDVNHSPLWFANTSIEYWLNRGVNADKIVLGMPLYAGPSWIQYRDLVKSEAQNAYHDYAKTVPLESYYNGLNTLRDKTLLALSKCGGVMIFDINEDVDWRDEKLGKYSAISMIDEVIGRLSGLTRGNAGYHVTVVIDNEELKFSEEDNMGVPFIDAASRTDVPLRKPLEKIGAEVSYDEKTKMVKATKGNITVQIPINQKYILVNGESVHIDSGAVIIGGRTYLPIRAVMEAFGYNVKWNQTSKTVYIEN